jgi:hypothetical protein
MAKSLAPDDTPCASDASGLLQRASIVASAHVPIGKETDRRSEHGGDWSLLQKHRHCGVAHYLSR